MDNPTATDLARRVLERCNELAAFSEESGRITRTFLSPPMRAVHLRLTEWMRAAGLTVRVDAAGNIIGRLAAASGPPGAPVFLLGSHLDSVPDAGRYDGVLGVLLALAVVESWGGAPRPFPVEVIGFSEEEGVRFGTPYLGSRAVVGRFGKELRELRDARGVTVDTALRAFGLEPTELSAAAYPPGGVRGYLEVHIEQGPILEARNLPAGIVTAIAGQTRARFRFTGQAAHAGTTPMPMRRDALVAAAEWIVAAEAHALSTPGLVATVGGIRVEPGVGNVIPGAAEVSLDLRHAVDSVRLSSFDALFDRAKSIAARRGLTCALLRRQDFAAVPMHDKLRATLAAALSDIGQSPVEMVSGAGHDAAIVSEIAPVALLFLRSPNGGLSHHPGESVNRDDVATALRVMARFFELLEENPT